MAVACVDWPALIEFDASVTPTNATAAMVPVVTVIAALPDLVPREAVIKEVPADTPIMSPEVSTDATAGLLELQVTVRNSVRCR
jgi:hypothetical protein